MNTATISAKQLYDLFQAGQAVELIDVRTPVEYREAHLSFARNVPLDRLQTAKFAAAQGEASRPLYVICRSGSRGQQACEKLAAAGYASAINVEGGTQAWEQAGLPVVRGQHGISLERQVRIASGALVLSGALLGYFAHPYWIALAAVVGAGLVFAGITDTCGMGMLLARMPWNRVADAPENSDAAGTKTREEQRTTCCCG